MPAIKNWTTHKLFFSYYYFSLTQHYYPQMQVLLAEQNYYQPFLKNLHNIGKELHDSYIE